MFALRCGGVDFEGERVWVRRTVFRKRLVPPKGNRIRDVPMSKRVLNVLTAYREIRRRGVYRGRSEYLWPREDGSLTTHQDHVNRPLLGALKQAKLRTIRFHDLRHTFASSSYRPGARFRRCRCCWGTPRSR